MVREALERVQISHCLWQKPANQPEIAMHDSTAAAVLSALKSLAAAQKVHDAVLTTCYCRMACLVVIVAVRLPGAANEYGHPECSADVASRGMHESLLQL